MSPFGIDHGWFSKASYYAAAKGVGGVARQAAKRTTTPRLKRIQEAELQGRLARFEDAAAKKRGTAGVSPESRPSFGARRKAWDKGFNS